LCSRNRCNLIFSAILSAKAIVSCPHKRFSGNPFLQRPQKKPENKLFKNIKSKSKQEINLFFYSYSRILVALAQTNASGKYERQMFAVGAACNYRLLAISFEQNSFILKVKKHHGNRK